MDYTLRDIASSDWITILATGCFILLVIARSLYPKRFEEFFMLPLTNKYFLVQGRNNEILHPFNLLLFIIQVISVSLLLYLILLEFSPDFAAEQSGLYYKICLVYMLFIGIKYVLEKLTGYIFSIDSLVNNYLYQKLTYRNLLSILLLVINLILIYVITPGPWIFLIICGSIVLLNAMTLFYSYKSNGNIILNNFFYFILYLCALEISPYILLYQVVIAQG